MLGHASLYKCLCADFIWSFLEETWDQKAHAFLILGGLYSPSAETWEDSFGLVLPELG